MNKADTEDLIDEVRKNPGITKSALSNLYYNSIGARHTIAMLVKSGRLIAIKGEPRSAQLFLGEQP